MRRINSLEGVYSITEATTKDELAIAAGKWHFSDVRVVRRKEDSRACRTWLITTPPGAQPNTFVLLNVQSGTFAGVWREEYGRGNHHVKCSPSHLSAANVYWMLQPGLSEARSVVFRWRGGVGKALVRVKESEVVAVRDLDDDGDMLEQWRLVQQKDTEHEIWPDWMGHLPDNLRLDEINLPATHQSLANHGVSSLRPDLNWNFLGDDQPRPWTRLPIYIDNPRCQDSSLWVQLQMGIRGFDLRLDLDRVPILKAEEDGSMHESTAYYLYARHGLAEMGCSWSAALLIFRHFLQSNPTECILANIRYEKASPSSRDRSKDWMSTFVDETSKFWQKESPSIIYKWWEPGAARPMHELTLADVRGKLILTTGDGDYMPVENGRKSGFRFYPRDMIAVGRYDSPRNEWDQQLQLCSENLNAAKESHRYHQTSLNVSGLPAPCKYSVMMQSILRHPLPMNTAWKRAQERAYNTVFDPIDFFAYAREKWSAESGPLSERSLGRNGQCRVGKVDLDFSESVRDLVANIVRSNRTVAGREF